MKNDFLLSNPCKPHTTNQKFSPSTCPLLKHFHKTTTEHSADADSGEVIERLRKENSFVLCQLEEKNKKIKEFESLQKSKNASDEGDPEGSHASCREQNQKLQMQIDDLKRRLEEKKVENTNLNSHVSILESQIRASAVRIKSHEDILDFDEGWWC